MSRSICKRQWPGMHMNFAGHRYQPPLTELGTTNRQDRLLEVDVGKLEIQRFGQAQARHTEQADQAVEHPRA